MSFTYCQSCGNKNLYSLDLPKFCGSCGVALGKATRVKPATALPEPGEDAANLRVEHDPEGSDVFEVPQIDKLRYTFSSEMDGARKIALKDLVPELEELVDKNLPDEQPKKRKRGRPKKAK